jgi:hypothetical protein
MIVRDHELDADEAAPLEPIGKSRQLDRLSRLARLPPESAAAPSPSIANTTIVSNA